MKLDDGWHRVEDVGPPLMVVEASTEAICLRMIELGKEVRASRVDGQAESWPDAGEGDLKFNIEAAVLNFDPKPEPLVESIEDLNPTSDVNHYDDLYGKF